MGRNLSFGSTRFKEVAPEEGLVGTSCVLGLDTFWGRSFYVSGKRKFGQLFKSFKCGKEEVWTCLGHLLRK